MFAGCEEAGFEPFQTGADQVLKEPYISRIRGKRVGLITNQTGIRRDFTPISTVLNQSPDVELTALFGPEHGIGGAAEAGETVTSSTEVYSLYGDTRAPTPEMLENVDVLIYDIQDVGVRFYTFISTMFESMKAAAEKGIPFMVLDRPDPIGGSRVEGPVVEEERYSFVGIHSIPIRYGMTPGELARLFQAERIPELVLWVVPLKGWRRTMPFNETGLPWIAPSPNMPTVLTAALYPGTCLIEGTNLSEGRGTTRPFELIGAPWFKAQIVAGLLNSQQLPGVHFRSQAFKPSFSKYAGESCSGIQLHVTDESVIMPIRTALYLLRETLNTHPGELVFREQTFDRLVGNDWVRRMLIESRTVDAIEARWKADLDQFLLRREKYLLYP
jgi:uncharacterized protein YbbC (DUF1343 family)